MSETSLENILNCIDRYNSELNKEDDMSNSKSLLRSELRTLEIIKKELEWRDLTSDKKQKNRKIKVEKLEKLVDIDCAYEKSVVDLFDALVAVKKTTTGLQLYRMQAIIDAEMYFINEHSQMDKIRHNDFFVFTQLLDHYIEIGGQFNELGFEDLKDRFILMYKNWSKRPIKDIF